MYFYLILCVFNVFPQEKNLFVGEWEANINNNKITLELLNENFCYITIKTYINRKEIVETTQGTYSFDENIIRLNGTFFNSKIQNINSINWISLYQFNNIQKSSFSILIPDFNNEINFIRAIFSRIIIYE